MMTTTPSPSSLPRRRFLHLASGTAGALALGACSWNDAVRESVAASTTTVPTTTTAAPLRATGRPLLVVVNLGGGNDGLNTFVPEEGRYRDLRPAIGVAEEELLDTGAGLGLHPALEPIHHHWAAGQMAIVHGLGLPDQTRSHFTATDVWFAGQPDIIPNGWLGRWLDLHPLAGTDPLLAVALGGGRSAVTGDTASSTVIARPDQFLLQATPGMNADALADVLLETAAPATGDTDAMRLVRQGIPRAVNAVQILDEIGDDAAVASLGADSASGLLAVASRIVQLNLSTEVIMVDVGGYDTHANQVDTHAELLSDLAIGIDSFFTELTEAQVDRDVLLMTTSEFGRRAQDNGSGTDHGTANSHLLIGSSVAGGRYGSNGLDNLIDGDLPIDIDTRSHYATALHHLGAEAGEVLSGPWEDLGII